MTIPAAPDCAQLYNGIDQSTIPRRSPDEDAPLRKSRCINVF